MSESIGDNIWQLFSSDQSMLSTIEKSPTVLGCSAACDVLVQHPSVLPQHLQFNLEGSKLAIHALDGADSTFLNGRHIKKANIRAKVGRSYQLQVGEMLFEIIYGPTVVAALPQKVDPPPLAEAPEWFFSSDGVTHGPLTLDAVFDAVDEGRLRPTDTFWGFSRPAKVKAFEVVGLFDEDSDEEAPAPRVATSLAVGTGSVMCPYCWFRFEPDAVMFIANHTDLLGDAVLGSDQPQRFIPTRFTPEGSAIDAGGVVCPDMACPQCHMRLPGSLLDEEPLFMSIVGAPGAGKSYFLASAVWALRTALPQRFNMNFMDVDAVTNQWLNDYEGKLFFQADGQTPQTIVKTDQTAPHVYRQVFLQGMPVFLPLPCLFTLSPNGTHDADRSTKRNRTLVMYDNAGEHFQAGGDTASAPGTKHLVHAEGILFLFDPTEDPRFQSILKRNATGVPAGPGMQRQDVLLIEMISRIRKHLGLGNRDRIQKTIMVGISKSDLLADFLPLDTNPLKWSEEKGTHALDLGAISAMSHAARSLMLKYAPEIVTTVESFSQDVVYIPNSALGHDPSEEGVRPGDIRARWVDVPFLYVLARLGYVPTMEVETAARNP